MKHSFINSMAAACREATACLGWPAADGVDAYILGARLVVVASLAEDEIAKRVAEGLFPIADPWLLQCHANLDPAFLTRPAPVTIHGALAFRQGWHAARSAASTVTAFAPRAVVLPPRACRPAVLTEAAVTGMGVVCWDGTAAQVLALPGLPSPGKRTQVHRLVEETVWAAIMRSVGNLVLAPDASAV